MCKDCKGITLLKGENGVGIVSIADNNDGTFTILLSDGTTYTTSDFTGVQGAYGGWSSRWLYNTTTTNTPASTNLRFNNATPGSATQVYINTTNANGVGVTSFLNSFKNTINAVDYFGLIKIYKESFPEYNYVFAKVTGYTLVGSVATITITVVQSSGSFAANDDLIVDFTPNGEKGDTGASFKYIKEVTSIFDGDIVSITQAELAAAGVLPTGYIQGGLPQEYSDIHVQLWYSNGIVWYQIPITSTPGGANVSITAIGTISIKLDMPAVSPAVSVRIVVLG